ncbi:MAG TPA: transposase [Gammaproteobacteria bacterium]|nr:transposase [Gammaproteobacteria bacterium]
MPRKARFFIPKVIRGNSRKTIFAEEEDYQSYLQCLLESKEELDCEIYSYVLMTNHVPMLLSVSKTENISKLSQSLGRCYVPYFNQKYSKSGTLCSVRFKANSIDSEHYLLSCYRYIELNPVRAGIVEKPEEYQRSSYRCNAYGEKNDLITPHELYLELGENNKQRLSAYRDLFKEVMDENLIKEISSSLQTGTPLGSQKFKDEIEELLGMKVGYTRQGRPQKIKPLGFDEKTQLKLF